MAIKHTKIAIPDVDKVTCVDWNADHVIDGNTGEVLFLTAGGNVGTDANLFWDDTNKRLGIGTTTPSEKLEVTGNILLSKGAARSISVGTEAATDGRNLTITGGAGDGFGNDGGDLILNGGVAGMLGSYGNVLFQTIGTGNIIFDQNVDMNSNYIEHLALVPGLDHHAASKKYVDDSVGLSSFDTGWINRSDWTNVHLGSVLIDLGEISGFFTIGETITESTSGNTGVVTELVGETGVYVKEVTGTGVFTNAETLTGGTSEETASVDGNTKDTDENVTHNLNAPLSDLLVKVLISTDGYDANSFEVFSSIGDVANKGLTIFAVDNNNVQIQTGLLGIEYIDGTGNSFLIDGEDWYYKIKVYKLA